MESVFDELACEKSPVVHRWKCPPTLPVIGDRPPTERPESKVLAYTAARSTAVTVGLSRLSHVGKLTDSDELHGA